jgi:hypothetical protein
VGFDHESITQHANTPRCTHTLRHPSHTAGRLSPKAATCADMAVRRAENHSVSTPTVSHAPFLVQPHQARTHAMVLLLCHSEPQGAQESMVTRRDKPTTQTIRTPHSRFLRNALWTGLARRCHHSLALITAGQARLCLKAAGSVQK